MEEINGTNFSVNQVKFNGAQKQTPDIVQPVTEEEPKLKDFPVFRERRASSSLKPHSKGLIRSGFKSKKAVAVSH